MYTYEVMLKLIPLLSADHLALQQFYIIKEFYHCFTTHFPTVQLLCKIGICTVLDWILDIPIA